MRAGAQLRTVFAGFGVSGSLLAAVGAMFVIAGGVLAFDQWPSESADPPVPGFQVAGAPAPPATPADVAAVDLPAAAATGDGTPDGTANGNRPPRSGPRETPGPGTPSGGNPAGVPPASPAPAAPTAPVEVPRTDGGLAGAVESTTGATADGVRSVGTALPIAAPITDLVGGLVDNAGSTVGGLLRGLAPQN